MREIIVGKLKKMEDNLAIYNAYTQNPLNSQENRNLVSFKILYEMMGFVALHELVPDYVPTNETMGSMTQGLAGTTGFVDIVDGKVVISPSYRTVLAQKEQYLKDKNNGKMG